MNALKITFITALAAVIISVAAILPQRICFDEGTSYTFFCGTSSADCREITVTDGAALKRLTLSDVCGEATTYPRLDVASFLKKVNGKEIFCERLSDSVNYYCTADLPYSVNLYGSQINLHVCIREDGVTVASPIIFGGY